MLTQPNHKVVALVFSNRALSIEANLLANYLGDDLHAACEVAALSGDSVLVSSAALPAKNRRIALQDWRKRVLIDERNRVSGFAEYVGALPADLRENVQSGEVPLAELDSAVVDYLKSISSAKAAVSTYWKTRLREAIVGIVSASHGEPVHFAGFPVPSHAVITADGDSGFFKNRQAAVEYGRGHGVRYLLLSIAREGSGFHVPSEPETLPDGLSEAPPASSQDARLELEDLG